MRREQIHVCSEIFVDDEENEWINEKEKVDILLLDRKVSNLDWNIMRQERRFP